MTNQTICKLLLILLLCTNYFLNMISLICGTYWFMKLAKVHMIEFFDCSIITMFFCVVYVFSYMWTAEYIASFHCMLKPILCVLMMCSVIRSHCGMTSKNTSYLLNFN